MKPDNDVTTAPFGAFAPNAAQAAVIRLVHRSGLKRGVFRPWMSRLVNLIRPGPVDAQYHGASFRFYHLGASTERAALFNPGYDLDELTFLRVNVPEGGVFVDVGANVGIYALTIAKMIGDKGTVIAIEPHPVARARLTFNRDASDLAHVNVVAAAAGASDGELLIETDRANLGASHIVTGETSTGAFRVPAFTLQRILGDAGITRVDALKIDVEGFEDRVLTGFFAQAPQTLWPRAVVIEHLSRDEWQNDCIDDMIARGYAVKGKTRSNMLLSRA